MNRLITEVNGGFPWFLDDQRWSENGIIEALTGLIKGLNINEDNTIIAGVDLTLNGSNQDVSSGFVMLNGEILKVDAHSFSTPTTLDELNRVKIEKVVTYDPEGLKNLEDGGTADAYQQNRAVISLSPVDLVATDVNFLNFKQLPNVIANQNAIIQDAWKPLNQTILGVNRSSFINLPIVSGQGQAFKAAGNIGFIQLDSTFTITGEANNFSLGLSHADSDDIRPNGSRSFGVATVTDQTTGDDYIWTWDYITGQNIMNFRRQAGQPVLSAGSVRVRGSVSFRIS